MSLTSDPGQCTQKTPHSPVGFSFFKMGFKTFWVHVSWVVNSNSIITSAEITIVLACRYDDNIYIKDKDWYNLL